MAAAAALRISVQANWMLVNSITMLSVILTGAALIRERAHGTGEHLLVMPVGLLEIMFAELWSMGTVMLLSN